MELSCAIASIAQEHQRAIGQLIGVSVVVQPDSLVVREVDPMDGEKLAAVIDGEREAAHQRPRRLDAAHTRDRLRQ